MLITFQSRASPDLVMDIRKNEGGRTRFCNRQLTPAAAGIQPNQKRYVTYLTCQAELAQSGMCIGLTAPKDRNAPGWAGIFRGLSWARRTLSISFCDIERVRCVFV